MKIKFGPAGLGPVKDAVKNLEMFSKLGLKACEIAFTYGVYIKKDEDAVRIRKAAEKYGIKLSIHAPYWINLNSKEPEKIEASKQRILKCCEMGEKLGAYLVVFHPGYYGDMEKEVAYSNIRDRILEMMEEVKTKRWKIKLAPETMGKVNVFGSYEDIARLVEDTGCSFCIDFAHILAREKRIEWKDIKKKFGRFKPWHVHFSGIEYGEKGERNHIKTPEDKLKELIKNLPVGIDIVVINESPCSVEDSVLGLRLAQI